MKISNEDFATVLAPAAAILKGKATQEAPRYLRIEATKGRLKLSAHFDNQSSITEVDCDGDLKPLCVQFHLLQNINPLFDKNITMDWSGNGNLQIKSRGNFSIGSMPENFYSEMPLEKMNKIAVNCADLAECIDKVKFCSRSTDERPTLYGVTVRLSPKRIIAEASTGLAMASMTKASISVEAEFLIPYPFVENISNALKKDGAVLLVSKTKMGVEFDGGCYMCSFLEVEPQKSMLRHFEKRKAIGEVTPAEWAPIFRSVNAMATDGEKMSPRVFIEAGRLKYEGIQGTVDAKVDKLTKPLKLNASTFLPCLESFSEATCKASIAEGDALVLEQGDYLLATTQLRG